MNTNYYPSSCRAWRRGPAQPQIPFPTPHPVLRTMSLITLMQTRNLGTIVTRPRTPALNLFQTLGRDLRITNPAKTCKVCRGFLVWPNSSNAPKNSPSTKHPSTINQARQLSTRNLTNTSKFSNKTVNRVFLLVMMGGRDDGLWSWHPPAQSWVPPVSSSMWCTSLLSACSSSSLRYSVHSQVRSWSVAGPFAFDCVFIPSAVELGSFSGALLVSVAGPLGFVSAHFVFVVRGFCSSRWVAFGVVHVLQGREGLASLCPNMGAKAGLSLSLSVF